MKKILVILSLAALILGSSIDLAAQKLGYIDSYALFAEMPAVKTADQQLLAFEEQKMATYQSKVKELEALYAGALQKQQAGSLTPTDQERISTQLQTGQQAILQMEQQIQADVVKKRQELYEPILKKVDDAIKAVSKELNYEMIFDTTSGILLYADEADDISKQVRAKLGF